MYRKQDELKETINDKDIEIEVLRRELESIRTATLVKEASSAFAIRDEEAKAARLEECIEFLKKGTAKFQDVLEGERRERFEERLGFERRVVMKISK